MINENNQQTGQAAPLPEPYIEISHPASRTPRYRFEVSEKAVWEMQPWLVRATKESYTTAPVLVHLDGITLIKSLSPHRWVCRFRDAILGLKRYRYEITGLDPDYTWDSVSACELQDGRVEVNNKRFLPAHITTNKEAEIPDEVWQKLQAQKAAKQKQEIDRTAAADAILDRLFKQPKNL